MSEHNIYNTLTSQSSDYERDVLAFGQKIRATRQTRGISLDKLADLTGIDKAALSRMENGARIPKYDTFLRIVDALESPLEDIMPSRFFEDDGIWARIRALYKSLPESEKEVTGRYILAMLTGLRSVKE